MNHSLNSLTRADSDNWVLQALNSSLIETMFVIALQKKHHRIVIEGPSYQWGSVWEGGGLNNRILGIFFYSNP